MSLGFRKILCPVDMSPFSQGAIKLGVKFAQDGDATLYLLHVIDNPFDDLYMGSITQADPALLDLYKNEPAKRARLMTATLEHSQVLLKQFCHDWIEHLPKVRYLVANGNPFEKILDAANDYRIDLIVLATHGRTGVKRLLIGNVAEKVIRYAPCPVLTVKPRKTQTATRKSTSAGTRSRNRKSPM